MIESLGHQSAGVSRCTCTDWASGTVTCHFEYDTCYHDVPEQTTQCHSVTDHGTQTIDHSEQCSGLNMAGTVCVEAPDAVILSTVALGGSPLPVEPAGPKPPTS